MSMPCRPPSMWDSGDAVSRNDGQSRSRASSHSKAAQLCVATVVVHHDASPRLIPSVRLSFQPLIFRQPAVFFSHIKSANSTFSRLFSAKRTGRSILLSLRTHRGVRVVRTDGGRVTTVDHRENSLFFLSFYFYKSYFVISRNLPNA
jgi:hypothetical protein